MAIKCMHLASQEEEALLAVGQASSTEVPSNFTSPIPDISNRFQIIVSGSAASRLVQRLALRLAPPLFDVAVHEILNCVSRDTGSRTL